MVQNVKNEYGAKGDPGWHSTHNKLIYYYFVIPAKAGIHHLSVGYPASALSKWLVR